MGPLRPTFEEFRELARSYSVVPVGRELVADTLTPVSAAAAVANEPGSFLFESVVGGEKWARYSFVGFAPTRVLRGRGDALEVERRGIVEARHPGDPWRALRELMGGWRAPRVPWLPRFWGGAVGYVSYDAVRRFEPSVGPRSQDTVEFSFGVGGTLLVFDAVRQTATVVVPVELEAGHAPEDAYAGAVARVDDAARRLLAPRPVRPLALPRPGADLELPASSLDRDRFCAIVERIQEHIRAGDLFQCVPSQRFRVPRGEVDLFDVYRAMRVVNPSPYMYFLRMQDGGIAGASPETLVRLEHGRVEVRPIAGTRRRGASAEADARVAEELLRDPKERAEHVMLVDLGRNDVGRISAPGTVRLAEEMAIERYSHVMHIVSSVTGEVAPGLGPLDVLQATFPAGTLTGAPKVRAMQILADLEPEPRGLYGGAVGYLGYDGNMDLAICIRTVIEQDGTLSWQAGAGVVEASVPEREYDETVQKARAALTAVEAARASARGAE